MKKQTSGFSLTELLVTLVILGTLIGIAVPMYRGMTASGAARVHSANFEAAVSFVASQCQNALLNPGGLSNIYNELNGGPAGSETKFAPGGAVPAFSFNNAAGVAAGQVDITGPVAPNYQCTAGLTPVTITSGGVAAGAAAGDYPNGDPTGFARTIQ